VKLVLLPGLDGTGILFEPLIKELSNDFKIQVISYPPDKELSYSELVEYVKSHLPKEDYILLAESFSGYIAYNIALSKPKNLKGLILVAAFLKNPRVILLKFILISKIFTLPMLTILIRALFLGFKTELKTIKLFKTALKKVSPNVIGYRLKEITKLKTNTQKIKLKTLYIQATNDKLVPKSPLIYWQKVFENLEISKIKGGHLILQSKPKECSRVIAKYFDII